VANLKIGYDQRSLSHGEKITQIHSGDNSPNSNNVNCQIQSDQTLIHQIDKLQIQLTAKEKDVQLLENRLKDLEELLAFYRPQ
jgi:uncharacterized protein (DUF3084 family)